MFVRLWLHQNHYRLITVDLSWQKELYADPKAIPGVDKKMYIIMIILQV